ncbi:MAG: hypothetical protein AAFU85_23220, partial [Planctomycetota bacterium]
ITQARVIGTGEQSALTTTDLSDNPTDLTELMSNGDNLPDDPNAVRIPWITVTETVAGTPVAASSGTQGNYDVMYTIRIDNDGSTALEDIRLTEDFRDHLGNAFVGLVGTSLVGGNATDFPTLDVSYTGDGATDQLFDPADTSRLDSGQFLLVNVTIEVDPDAAGQIEDSVSLDGDGNFETQAFVSGQDPTSGVIVTDTSDDPADLRDVDGDPANPLDTSDDDNDPDDPTALWLPTVELTKTQIGNVVPASSGTPGNFDVVYDLEFTNIGNEPLEALSLIEDLQTQFGGSFVRVVPQFGSPATVVGSTATDTPEINAAYTGTAAGSTDLFSNAAGDTNLLDTGQSVTVRLIIEFDADAAGGNRINGEFVTSADVFGTGSHSTITVTDRSDDPVVVAGVDVGADNDPDDPNMIRVPDITLTKVVLGTPTAANSGIVGNFDVTYELVVQNTGTTPLENLVVIDDWTAQFGGAFIRVLPGTLAVTNINADTVPNANASYSGASGQNMLDGTGAFSSGQSFRIQLTVEVDPNAPGAIRQIGSLVNQAVVTANDPFAPMTTITDLSDDPTDATNVDGDPGTSADDDNNPDDPTAFGFTDIGVSKRIVASALSTTTAGAMTFTYELVVRNVGSGDLQDLTLIDDIQSGLGSAFVGVVSGPLIVSSDASVDPTFTANFDGNLLGSGNTAIFDGTSGLLRPTEEITLQFAIDVHPEFLTTSSDNQAIAGGRNGLETVSDRSDTGSNPEDTNPGPQNDSTGEDDSTLIPGLSIVKRHGDAIAGSPGQWVVPITLEVENTGSLVLEQLVLSENLAAQFGGALIGIATPVLDTSPVTHASAPNINTAWQNDPTQNLLAPGGGLNPGDSFTIQVDVIVDPDASGGSSFLQNQATISGINPNAPLIFVVDQSDSGSVTTSENPGAPGDTGSTDDPTPLQIAEIGSAKRVTNVEMTGLTSLVTLELIVENTGTVHLQELDLFDDISTQWGANFVGVVGGPEIIRSTATMDPSINTGFAADSTQNVFDGRSGFLAPGEQVVVQLVVEVEATPGQATVVLVNQASVAGTPVDAGRGPVLDSSGIPFGRVTDLSDSGVDTGSTNPGAPGDTGGFDDPTSTPITFFTFDRFNDFSRPFGPDSDPIQKPSSRFLSQQIPSLAPNPIFSGAARPGTKIIARVFDSDGFQIGREEVYADVGGNWMMQVHNLERVDYVRVDFEEVAGNASAFAPTGDIFGYLGDDQHRNLYTALEPWAGYDHEFDFTAVYRDSASRSLHRMHVEANRPIGFGL